MRVRNLITVGGKLAEFHAIKRTSDIWQGIHTVEETEMQSIAIAGLRKTAEEVLRFSQHLQTSMGYDMAASSPLVADCLYQAAATYAWLVYETGSPDMVLSLQTLTECLKMLAGKLR
jgi:hypothetical protein